MNDVKESLHRAMVKQSWYFGDRATRIGSPFEWTENESKPNILKLEALMAVYFYYSMFYVKRETSKDIMIPDYDEVRDYCNAKMYDSFKHFFPFKKINKEWQNHIESQGVARAQDYCFIKTHCKSLPDHPSHVDIGPGLGSAGIYNQKYLNSKFFALEASSMSYSVQRKFFRFLSPYAGAYLDVIECENFQLTDKEITKQLGSDYAICHVPSWRFPLIASDSIDIATATFVLNELNYAGILWILAEASRTIKKGGYFYIRDSFILKPGLHSIEYDKVLQKIGFKKVAQLKFKHRYDHFGIPRVFQKKSHQSYSFEEMVHMCLGRYASVASGAGKAYNLEFKPKQ